MREEREVDTAARLVRVARRGSGLTQRKLAAAAQCSQPEIARLERSGHAVSLDLVERLVRGARQRLVTIPTRRTPVAEHADAIAEWLARSDESRAFRVAIQLADDLAGEQGAIRVALAVTPPPATGDSRFDALIAGITEYRLVKDNLPLPEWLARSGDPLSPVWFVDPYSQGDSAVVAATPEPLRRRGVILDAAELESV